MKLKYEVEKEMLVKEYLEYKDISHHLRKKVRLLDNLKINGSPAKNYYLLHKGDILELEFYDDLNDEYEANYEDLALLDIKYEDEYLIILSKPNNISSQPSRKYPTYNMLSILKAYFINNNINSNIHLVNRLDMATSGLMIIAKNNVCAGMFANVKITKKYVCLVNGKLKEKEGLIDLNIAREEAPSIKRYVSPAGQTAKTHYKVLKEYDDKSLVEVELFTGRTHQIRVHLSYLGAPIVGDKIYGGCENNQKFDLFLHAYYLAFIHPFTLKEIEIIDYPNWFSEKFN